MEKSADCQKTAAPPIAIGAVCVRKCVRGDWPSLKGGQSFLPLEGEGISPFVTSHLIEFSVSVKQVIIYLIIRI